MSEQVIGVSIQEAYVLWQWHIDKEKDAAKFSDYVDAQRHAERARELEKTHCSYS
jgi:hypothetical protein